MKLFASTIILTIASIAQFSGFVCASGKCVGPQFRGSNKSYIVTLKPGVSAKSSEVSQLKNEIQCQGGKIIHTYDIGNFQGFSVRINNDFVSWVQSSSVGSNIESIEADGDASIF